MLGSEKGAFAFERIKTGRDFAFERINTSMNGRAFAFGGMKIRAFALEE